MATGIQVEVDCFEEVLAVGEQLKKKEKQEEKKRDFFEEATAHADQH